jgi:hypothetical protein
MKMNTKGVTVGIILLFLGISCSPVITAENIQQLSPSNHYLEKTLVPIRRYEYKSDGSIEKTSILLPKNEYLKMTQNLSLTGSLEEKLRVYQGYGVIPSNVTIQQMKENFNHYLRTQNINISAIQKYSAYCKKTADRTNIRYTNCSIDATSQFGIYVNVGMSALTRFWNFIALCFFQITRIGPLWLPGIDLCDVNVNGMGIVQAYLGGIHPSITFFGFFMMILCGFIGFFIEFLPLLFFNFANEYIGYTVFFQATGLPGGG